MDWIHRTGAAVRRDRGRAGGARNLRRFRDPAPFARRSDACCASASLEALITITVVSIGCGCCSLSGAAAGRQYRPGRALILGLCASATSAGECRGWRAANASHRQCRFYLRDCTMRCRFLISALVLASGANAQTLWMGIATAALNISGAAGRQRTGRLALSSSARIDRRLNAPCSSSASSALLGGGAAYLGEVSPAARAAGSPACSGNTRRGEPIFRDHRRGPPAAGAASAERAAAYRRRRQRAAEYPGAVDGGRIGHHAPQRQTDQAGWVVLSATPLTAVTACAISAAVFLPPGVIGSFSGGRSRSTWRRHRPRQTAVITAVAWHAGVRNCSPPWRRCSDFARHLMRTRRSQLLPALRLSAGRARHDGQRRRCGFARRGARLRLRVDAAALAGKLFECIRLRAYQRVSRLRPGVRTLAGDLISRAMAAELRLVNGLAIALIAFIAGLEINLPAFAIGSVPSCSWHARSSSRPSSCSARCSTSWPWLPIAPEATGLTRFAMIAGRHDGPRELFADGHHRGDCRAPRARTVEPSWLWRVVVLAIWRSSCRSRGDAADAIGGRPGVRGEPSAHSPICPGEIFGSLAFGAIVGALFAFYPQPRVTRADAGAAGALQCW